MQNFNPIYSDTHQFTDGNITISHQVTVQSIVYVQIEVNGITIALDMPILRGFLYQELADGKRSRPYPIISAKQSIKLDLSVSNSFIFVPSNRLIDYYDLDIYIAEDSSGNSQNSGNIDLSAYALTTDLTWDNITGKPLTFNPSSHNHLISEITGLNDVLDDHEERLDALETATPSTVSGDSSYILVSANQALEANKKYLVTVAGLSLTLPSNPNIGDTITVSTGNFDVKVLQDNANHQILNASASTLVGMGNGLILKSNSDTSLIYLGNNLWKTVFKNRIINNWQIPTLANTASQLTYIPTFFNSPNIEYGTQVSSINDGIILTGDYINDGLLTGGVLVQIKVSFPQNVVLTSFDFYSGQGNTDMGASNNSYKSDVIKVYSGINLDNLLNTFNPNNLNGIKQAFTISDFTSSGFTNYIFSFERASGSGIGILELKLFGKPVVGGEIVVI